MQERVADVAVIGAGIIGSSIAWRLAQAGCRVTILDAGAFGGEASWAGAGMLAPGGEIEHRSAWADFALESMSLYPGFVAELQQESGCLIDYQRHGAVELAFTGEELDHLDARAAAQSEMGIASESLDHAGLRELLPLLDRATAGARYFPGDAITDPRHVTSALAGACRKRGVQTYEHRRVSAVRLLESGVEIESDAGRLTCARAVLAAGAWSGEVSVWRAHERVDIPASFPVKGHLLGYRLEAGSLGPIVRHAHTYLLQRANGFTIAGTSVENAGFDRRIDPGLVDDIHRRACNVLPCLAHAAPPQAWIGFRPATASLDPEIRRLPGSGLWLSYGHYRNGILLAPATAQRVSGEIIASLGTDSTLPGASH
jgi:glycine oxidase